MQLSDNGWHLPNSKHEFTENGYRTRLIVFDPTVLPSVPGWDADQQVIPPAQESCALAHSTDIHATAVGYALNSAPGTQLCPMAPDGTRCDGKDLRSHLLTAPGGPSAPESLRRALCGHDTQRSTGPDNLRYLLTREGSVGRCTLLSAPACSSDAQCPGGRVCLGGHCLRAPSPPVPATLPVRPAPRASAAGAAWARPARTTRIVRPCSRATAPPVSRRPRAGAATIPACAARHGTIVRRARTEAPAAGSASPAV